MDRRRKTLKVLHYRGGFSFADQTASRLIAISRSSWEMILVDTSKQLVGRYTVRPG